MNGTAASSHSQQLPIRRHLKGLTVGDGGGPAASSSRPLHPAVPAYLRDLARHHVVDEEMGMILGAHDEFLPVGRKARALDRKVLEVDRLDLGVRLPVHLIEFMNGRTEFRFYL